MEDESTPPPPENVPPQDSTPPPPEPPAAPPAPKVTTPAAAAAAAPPIEFGEVSDDEKLMGTLAHALGIFTWFLGPLIIWLIKKDESKFVDHHGKEALNFWIVVSGAIVISFPLMYLCIGFLTYAVAQIGGIVFSIIAAVEASKKRPYFYPVTIRFIK